MAAQEPVHRGGAEGKQPRSDLLVHVEHASLRLHRLCHPGCRFAGRGCERHEQRRAATDRSLLLEECQ